MEARPDGGVEASQGELGSFVPASEDTEVPMSSCAAKPVGVGAETAGADAMDVESKGNHARSGPEQMTADLKQSIAGISANLSARELERCIVSLFKGRSERDARALVERLVEVLPRVNATESDASRLVSALIGSANQIDQALVVFLISGLLASLSDPQSTGKLLDAVPQLVWLALKKAPTIACREIDLDDMSREEFQDYVCARICRAPWNKGLLLPITVMLRDLPLNERQLDSLIGKIQKLLPGLGVQQLPSFVHQYLLLASGKGCRAQVLKSIAGMFGEGGNFAVAPKGGAQSKAEREHLLQVQGTILLHFDFTIKHDQVMGNVLLRLVKTREVVLTPFTMAALLAIARIQRYHSKVMTCLVSYASSFYAGIAHGHTSPWIKWVGARCDSLHANLEQIAKRIVSHSSRGWDHIIPSLLELGMRLLDQRIPPPTSPSAAVPPQRGGGKVGSSDDAMLGEYESRLDLSHSNEQRRLLASEVNVVWLGTIVLKKLFKYHKVVRKEMLEQLLLRVITGENPVAALELLHALLSANPLALSDFVPAIKDALEYLSYMKPAVAVRFIQVLRPLLASRKDVKDYIVMVLRKSLFNHELRVRLVATRGFLALFQGSGGDGGDSQSLSQSSQSTNGSASASEEKLFLEALSILKRCMTQQARVRSEVYAGLQRLCHTQPSLRAYILDLLLPQVQKYFEPDESSPRPLVLDACFDARGAVVEALPELIVAAVRALAASDKSTKESTRSYKLLRGAIKSIAKRMLQLSPGDYQLVPPAGVDLSDDQRRRANARIELLRGVVEAITEFCVLKGASDDNGGLSEAGADWVFKLVELDEELAAVHVAKSNKPRSARGGRKRAVVATRFERLCPVILSGDAVLRLLWILSAPESAQLSDQVRQSRHLGSYILETAELYFAAQARRVRCRVPAEQRESMISECERAAPLLHRALLLSFGDGLLADSEASGRRAAPSPALRCLAALRSCFDTVAQLDADSIGNFCERFIQGGEAGAGSGDAKEEIAEIDRTPSVAVICALERYFNERVTVQAQREARGVLDLIERIERQIRMKGGAGTAVAAHHTWIKKQCVEKDITDGKLACAMLKHLHTTAGGPKAAFRHMAAFTEDLASLIGDMADEAPSSGRTGHAAISDATRSPVLIELLSWVEVQLSEVEWLLRELQRVAAPTGDGMDDDVDTPTDKTRVALAKTHGEYQDYAFGRLSNLCAVLNTLAVTKIDRPGVEEFFKVTTRVYKLVGMACKLLIRKKSRPSDKFQRLIQVTAKELTVNIYPFILFQQQLDGQHLDETKAKIGREGRIIPNLIYAVEQVERLVIKLSKQSKMNLAQFLKHSTARDFRIIVPQLEEAAAAAADKAADKAMKKNGGRAGKVAANCVAQEEAEEGGEESEEVEDEEEYDENKENDRGCGNGANRSPGSAKRKRAASFFDDEACEGGGLEDGEEELAEEDGAGLVPDDPVPQKRRRRACAEIGET